jgi:hypothetical protein
MNYTKLLTAVVVFGLLALGVAPAWAQGSRYRGLGGIGVSRGPMRALATSRSLVASPGGGAPFNAFNGAHYFFGPPVRVGYGVSVGYPVALPVGYASPYACRVPSPAPARGLGVRASSSLAIIGGVGAHVTRGAARLALRLLIP